MLNKEHLSVETALALDLRNFPVSPKYVNNHSTVCFTEIHWKCENDLGRKPYR